MGYIKNYKELARSPERKVVLDLVEAGLAAIQPELVIKKKISCRENLLKIDNVEIDLEEFKNVYILGFGKGSAQNAAIIEGIIGNKLTAGWVIDTTGASFKKIEFTLGTHPLPSAENLEFTKKVIAKLTGLTASDLVLVVTCGGGSVMFAAPHQINLEQLIDVNKALLRSGANIAEMNVVRKHIDVVKGGGLAKILFPATILNLVFSDVPGNDLSTIASGPTVVDSTTVADAKGVIDKRHLSDALPFLLNDLVETPKDSQYFEKIKNILVISNETALLAMQKRAEELGLEAVIFSENFAGNADLAGSDLVRSAAVGTILLCGGETELKITGHGSGGRNQQLVLASLKNLVDATVVCSFDSDGWDNSEAAGAIGDALTVEHAKKLGLDIEQYLKDDNTFPFFKKVGDAILTGRLPSNVSDLMIVFKK
ncbi:MAG TPA: DUF4147 domain-containing protein [Candidatus Saccharimonadales bacterium]|nr:DUF4147 domain-containing protein [Candidatus Saccharimonadales bacterium]